MLLPGCGCCGTCANFPPPQSIEVDIESTGFYYWWVSTSKDNFITGRDYYLTTAEVVCLKPVSGTFSLSPNSYISGYSYSDGRYVWLWDPNISEPKKLTDYNNVGRVNSLYPYVEEFSVDGTTTSINVSHYIRRAVFTAGQHDSPPNVSVPTKTQMESDGWKASVESMFGFYKLNDYHSVPYSDFFFAGASEYCDGQYGSVLGKTPSYRLYGTAQQPSSPWSAGCGLPLTVTGRVGTYRTGVPSGFSSSTNIPAQYITLGSGSARMSIPFTVSINEMRAVYSNGSSAKLFDTTRGAVCYGFV